MNGEGARQGAPEAVNHHFTRRSRYQRLLTPLQTVLQEQAQVFQHAREELDERAFDVMLEILTGQVVREYRRRLVREGRRSW